MYNVYTWQLIIGPYGGPCGNNVICEKGCAKKFIHKVVIIKYCDCDMWHLGIFAHGGL
jgi:hypothetical protein